MSGERGLLFYISFYLLLFMITTNSHLLLFLSFFSFFSFQLRFLFTSHRIASHQLLILHYRIQVLALTLAARAPLARGGVLIKTKTGQGMME